MIVTDYVLPICLWVLALPLLFILYFIYWCICVTFSASLMYLLTVTLGKLLVSVSSRNLYFHLSSVNVHYLSVFLFCCISLLFCHFLHLNVGIKPWNALIMYYICTLTACLLQPLSRLASLVAVSHNVLHFCNACSAQWHCHFRHFINCLVIINGVMLDINLY